MEKFDIGKVKFDEKGLCAAIAQDYKTGLIMMIAWMNKEALELTLATRKVHYWSRSRNKLWFKGEESGNVQEVKNIYIDCDMDAVLIKVNQIGGAACHTGYASCFYREIKENGDMETQGEKIFDPEKVYKKKG
ncbi:MAG: phosphoribosyl-AMP cyclohydrolase [Candidatus Aerophobetes bacterium ADurb.Bin490]|nr:MAG: phosphoribosyl-AMP cyclohydrolase [Candidatus Aerophobetes bacterium ADurb.Bin490]HNZ28682.1 phosphoribosyl-AMP cyclohydrolase [Candidatus Goldiibacteriota bacterium]HPI03556.1 phosphoribosyl-AMP cyclohydrolase [Candidatus Goldiibacteriota bacterium]HPN65285.1 phosphoribosyl-AMP cyclohydrolase [Candidatus Goldiibacteriota bacterium]HRQ43789.1 phosphoribosyl-AMP cyclohydrolase [Candidatus Goldiibacteriota bacterium]